MTSQRRRVRQMRATVVAFAFSSLAVVEGLEAGSRKEAKTARNMAFLSRRLPRRLRGFTGQGSAGLAVTGGQACVGGKFEAVGDGRAVADLGEDTGAGPWPDPWPRRARTDILRPWGRICLLLQQGFLIGDRELGGPVFRSRSATAAGLRPVRKYPPFGAGLGSRAGQLAGDPQPADMRDLAVLVRQKQVRPILGFRTMTRSAHKYGDIACSSTLARGIAGCSPVRLLKTAGRHSCGPTGREGPGARRREEAGSSGCGSPEVTPDLAWLEFIGLAHRRPSGRPGYGERGRGNVIARGARAAPEPRRSLRARRCLAGPPS
jgi:hypothetical protein